MKILSPLRSADEAGPLREAGADEFYCGLAPPGWKETFGSAWANRRHPQSAAVLNEQALQELVAAAAPVPVHVVLNSPHYPPGAVEMLAVYGTRLLRNLGISALIVADLDLLLALVDAGHASQLHLSSLATSTNAASSRFFRSLGISRIILPRHLTLAEIGQCVIHGVEFEAFVINDGCVFEEGLCATTHEAGTFCLADGDGLKDMPPGTLDRYAFFKWTQNNCGCNASRGFPLGPCGLCAIPVLQSAGVGSLKVVGREASLERKYASVKLTALARDIARNGGDANDIREATIALRGAASLCRDARACYYPDLWNHQVSGKKKPLRSSGT
ncbi:MAG: U32 family peptidase [Xanthomonadales bacterium]|nr:U32 family peptidase [Xanthomonadales bacterium]